MEPITLLRNIYLFVRSKSLHYNILVEIVKNLGVDILVVTPFKTRYIQGFISGERKVVP